MDDDAHKRMLEEHGQELDAATRTQKDIRLNEEHHHKEREKDGKKIEEKAKQAAEKHSQYKDLNEEGLQLETECNTLEKLIKEKQEAIKEEERREEFIMLSIAAERAATKKVEEKNERMELYLSQTEETFRNPKMAKDLAQE